MRRRSKRTTVRIRPIVIFAIVVSVGVGSLYSPLTAIRKVRVEGAPVADQARIERITQELKGIACLRVNPRIVETLILENPEIKLASLSRTPFGSATLHVAQRTPVAVLDPAKLIVLSNDGVVYSTSSLKSALPGLKIPEGMPEVGVTLGNGWRTRDIAYLAQISKGIPSSSPISIELDRGGRVCLNIDTGRVDLGVCADLDQKVAKLSQILQDRPSLFQTVAVLRLADVSSPVFVSKPVKSPQ